MLLAKDGVIYLWADGDFEQMALGAEYDMKVDGYNNRFL